MNIVSPTAISYSKNLYFAFSFTLRNEPVDLNNFASANYIIDVNGTCYGSAAPTEESASIVIIGGIDKFINEKQERMDIPFFITEPQKVVLYKIIKDLSKYTTTAEIGSNSETLEQSLCALYENYIG